MSEGEGGEGGIEMARQVNREEEKHLPCGIQEVVPPYFRLFSSSQAKESREARKWRV